MGTRSTVKFFNEYSEDPILSVYHQFDGYIDGVGHELAKFLSSKEVINGYNPRFHSIKTHANGMGCLAAQYVLENKSGLGGLYMTTADDTQEYNYEVRLINGQLIIKVDQFEGTPEELLKYDESEIEE